MHDHTSCEHKLKFCEKCDMVFCEVCKEEWKKEKVGLTSPQFIPAPNPYPYNTTPCTGPNAVPLSPTYPHRFGDFPEGTVVCSHNK